MVDYMFRHDGVLHRDAIEGVMQRDAHMTVLPGHVIITSQNVTSPLGFSSREGSLIHT